MRLQRRIQIQLAVFAIVSIVAATVLGFKYMGLSNMLFDVGHYTVTLQLPASGGLYKSSNVTYRGTEVGRVTDVRLTKSSVEAELSLRSNIDIPSDVRAEVHSVSAIGEQYVALLPQDAQSSPLKNGDVIPPADTIIPPDINVLLNQANSGLLAIPRDNLKTTVDESYIAIGGLGPELGRFVQGSTALAIDARRNLDDITRLIDQSQPVLDSQGDSANEIDAWATHLATISSALRDNDGDVAGILQHGPGAVSAGRELIERLRPAVPVLMANLVSIGQVAITYQPAIEQLLVLLPQGTAAMAATVVPNLHTKQDYKGAFLSFNLNLNVPPPCTTGFLPAQQLRSPVFEDAPDRPAGDLYCRTPQDAQFNVRGARNLPCLTVPGKRAPTVKMCESDENYVPLNNGDNWKGDPNATLSAQDIPQLPPQPPAAGLPAEQPPPPLAAAEYDPATGTYTGPDGQIYRQSDLAAGGSPKSWQDMLIAPGS